MSIYDIDFELQTDNLITPTKRKTKSLDYIYSIVSQLQYLRTIVLEDIRNGVSYPFYTAGAYVRGDRVIWVDNSVYECTVSTSTDCTDLTSWRQTQPNFIGVNERLKYNAQYIVFEEAINKWFNVTSAPFIYIAMPVADPANFEFDVMVPIAVFTALMAGGTSSVGSNRIKQFVNRYNMQGMRYEVITF